MPLLHVGPYRLVGDRINLDGEVLCSSPRRSSNIEVTGGSVRCARNVRLIRIHDQRGHAFERLYVGFVSIHMLEENPIAPANCHLAVALRIIGKAYAGCRIEEMALHAAYGNPG